MAEIINSLSMHLLDAGRRQIDRNRKWRKIRKIPRKISYRFWIVSEDLHLINQASEKEYFGLGMISSTWSRLNHELFGKHLCPA
ncbi:MAG: hypothetical protein IPG21_04565 [Saprospiraceae bacterium]|nr:hypothetical protein [Candidatus Vicinibacter affinis]